MLNPDKRPDEVFCIKLTADLCKLARNYDRFYGFRQLDRVQPPLKHSIYLNGFFCPR